MNRKMEMNTIQIDIEKYESMLKELGVLKTENEELKKHLSTTHNSKSIPCDHHRCSPGNYRLENYCDHPDAWEW